MVDQDYNQLDHMTTRLLLCHNTADVPKSIKHNCLFFHDKVTYFD